jgi:predicted enzyme related to lactoylglutathione lyase
MGVLVNMATTNAVTAAGVDAVYYMTRDFNRARNFYEGVLGLKPAWQQSNEGNDWIEYALSDGATFGLGYMADGEFRGSGGVLCAVSDVKQALEQAKQAGATVLFDAFEMQGCTMAGCLDPEGNSFYLHHRKDGTVG